MRKTWKDRIRTALADKPLRTGDLIDRLGFSLQSTGFDAMTRFTNGLKPLGGSFIDSPAQRTLAVMVHNGDVIYRRAANLDNWYRLPGQRFPRAASKRNRTLRMMAAEVMALLPKRIRDEMETDEFLEGIDEDDFWVELDPFVLSLHENGWELADGDPVCNWCGNTFAKVYPFNVDAAVIARKMMRVRPRIMRDWASL